MESIITKSEKVVMAQSFMTEWVDNSNTYLGVGRVTPWTNNIIPNPDNSADQVYDVYNRLFALVKITSADMQLVVPRVDWVSGTVYTAYDNSLDMYQTQLHVQKDGTISVTSGGNTVTGIDTSFTTDFQIGDFIEYIDTATNDIYLKEIIYVKNNTSMTVNSIFTASVTTDTYYNYTNTYPNYSYPFYVRNSFDQVYKCLYNNNGAPSTVMPQINIGGQLPSNPWIKTSDGYKWKYLYTIPSGLKQRFFNNQWMPAVDDLTVNSFATPGRIDVIQVLNGGTGYNSNVASGNAYIITITGDGQGANVAAVVNTSGTITDTYIISGGSGYTYANVSVDPGSTGSNANLRAVISPQGGHGSNSAIELGASNMMICVELDGTMGGLIPTESSLSANPIQYYQISIIQNPEYANNVIADSPIYDLTKRVVTGPLSAGFIFEPGDTAFQGITLNQATFSGTIVHWDSLSNTVYLNNTRGSFTPYSNFTASLLGRNVTAFNIFEPDIKLYTGSLLYMQNRVAVSRANDQTEQIKIVIEI